MGAVSSVLSLAPESMSPSPGMCSPLGSREQYVPPPWFDAASSLHEHRTVAAMDSWRKRISKNGQLWQRFMFKSSKPRANPSSHNCHELLSFKVGAFSHHQRRRDICFWRVWIQHILFPLCWDRRSEVEGQSICLQKNCTTFEVETQHVHLSISLLFFSLCHIPNNSFVLQFLCQGTKRIQLQVRSLTTFAAHVHGKLFSLLRGIWLWCLGYQDVSAAFWCFSSMHLPIIPGPQGSHLISWKSRVRAKACSPREVTRARGTASHNQIHWLMRFH